MSQIGGRFYDQVDTGVVVDIRAMPSHELQTSLAKEMEKYDELEQLDIRYRDLMCGASVSNVEAVWVVRNSSQTMMTDKDLQRFESKAWSDYVGKRFTQAGSTNGLGKTMFDIVRSLKLQMRHFVVHGFHPKVEAAETRVVQYLQGKEFLPISSWGLRETCIRLRRSEEFYAPFAIAVGTQLLCCNGNANGLNATRYNKDIQHAYRDVDVSALVKTLHEARSTLVKTLNQVDATDYVTRLSGLRFVVPQVDVPEAEPTIRGGSSITVSAGGGAGAAMPTVDLTPFQRELAAINAKIDNLGDLAPPSFDLNPVMELITSYQRRNEAQINTLYDILAAQMGIRAGPSPMMAAGGRGRGGGGAGGGGGGAGGGVTLNSERLLLLQCAFVFLCLFSVFLGSVAYFYSKRKVKIVTNNQRHAPFARHAARRVASLIDEPADNALLTVLLTTATIFFCTRSLCLRSSSPSITITAAAAAAAVRRICEARDEALG